MKEKKIENAAKALSVEEKIRLLVAKSDFTTDDLDGKLSEIVMSDGPCGIRRGTVENPLGIPSICYPSPHVLANSWDKNVVYRVGQALASDCAERQIDILLAPGINIKRTPFCGRNFEYFSEDPYLTGILATEYVKGLQENGVGASLKHFCLNNSEFDRNFQSSNVSYTVMRETYVSAFEMVIQNAAPFTVMCSYNPINGINCSENQEILDVLLRQKLGYDGVILSDWCSVHDRADALNASLDIMCPNEKRGYDDLYRGLEDGRIALEKIEESVERIFALHEKVAEAKKRRNILSEKEKLSIALDGAEKGIVLLKNEEDILPVRGGKIAVFGNMAENPSCVGGGSAGTVLREQPVSLANELKSLMPNAEIGYQTLLSHFNCMGKPCSYSVFNLSSAIATAKEADVSILVVGNDCYVESESCDRESLKLSPTTERVILELAKVTSRLIVIVEAGSAIDMTAWIDKVQGVVYSGFAGERINCALARILCGEVCPSGRLSETFPQKAEDTPSGLEKGNPLFCAYNEGVYVGYRWYEKEKVKPLFPFGFGLSYADFSYSAFAVHRAISGEWKVSLRLKNNSSFLAGEVVMVFVQPCGDRYTDGDAVLAGFEKVYLNQGEEKEVMIAVSSRAFEKFEEKFDAFQPRIGDYRLMIGKNREEILYSTRIKIENI